MNKLIAITTNNLTHWNSQAFNIVKDEQALNSTIHKFLEKDFDIKLDSDFVICNDRNRISLRDIRSGVGMLIFNIHSNCSYYPTDVGKRVIPTQEEEMLIFFKIITSIICCEHIHKLLLNNRIRKIQGKRYTKITDKNLKTNYKIYSQASISNSYTYAVSDKALIHNNWYSKKEWTIPSTLYTLPNNNTIKVFTKDNTTNILNTTISDQLTNRLFSVGYCYTNSEAIVSILKENNPELKIDFYSGWLINWDRPVHHAWVIINDTHLLDVSFKKGLDNMDIHAPSLEKGIDVDILTSNIPSTLCEFMYEEKPFIDKYNYGEIPSRNRIYIGVKSNADEARISFNKLLEDHPDHPDYQNIDKKTGANKTLTATYKLAESYKSKTNLMH